MIGRRQRSDVAVSDNIVVVVVVGCGVVEVGCAKVDARATL